MPYRDQWVLSRGCREGDEREGTLALESYLILSDTADCSCPSAKSGVHGPTSPATVTCSVNPSCVIKSIPPCLTSKIRASIGCNMRKSGIPNSKFSRIRSPLSHFWPCGMRSVAGLVQLQVSQMTQQLDLWGGSVLCHRCSETEKILLDLEQLNLGSQLYSQKMQFKKTPACLLLSPSAFPPL